MVYRLHNVCTWDIHYSHRCDKFGKKIREITRFNQNLDERTYKNTLPMKLHFYWKVERIWSGHSWWKWTLLPELSANLFYYLKIKLVNSNFTFSHKYLLCIESWFETIWIHWHKHRHSSIYDVLEYLCFLVLSWYCDNFFNFHSGIASNMTA